MRVDESLADYAISVAEKSGAEYAEAYLESSIASGYAVEQGVFNGAFYSDSTGLRVRLVKNRRMFTFSTNKLSREGVADAIRHFHGFKGIDTVLSKEKVSNASYEVSERKKIEDASTLEDLSDMDKALSEMKCLKFRSLYAGAGRAVTYFSNSEGSTIRSSVPGTFAVASIIVSSGKETRQSVLQFGNTGGYEQFDAHAIKACVVEKAKSMRNVLEKGVTLSKDSLRRVKNVVMAPEITGIAAHESVGHPCEADRVFGRESAQAGSSYLTKDTLGMEIGSGKVTLIDDPTIPHTNGFFLYDDEGTKARPKTLIKDGIQNELLMDRSYAQVLGRNSNGTSRSDSYSNEPLIRMSNTYLQAGDADFDELLSEAGDGIYLKSFMEWNIDDTRSFSRYQGNEAYLIKDGSICGPVKNFVLERSTLDFWHAVSLVGKEREFYIGTCGKGNPMQGVPVTMGGASALLRFR
jgi:TldD protein